MALRPSAVVVSLRQPDVSSARNTWPATIVGLTLLTDRVRLDLEGQPSALVDVTPAAVAELGLGSAGTGSGCPPRPPSSRCTATPTRPTRAKVTDSAA